MEDIIYSIFSLSFIYAGIFWVLRRTYYKAKFSDHSRINLALKFLMAFLISCILSLSFIITLDYQELILEDYLKLAAFWIPAQLFEALIIFRFLINFKNSFLGLLHSLKAVSPILFLLLSSFFFGQWLSFYLLSDYHFAVQLIAEFLPVILIIWKGQSLIRFLVKWWIQIKVRYSSRPYSLVLRSFSDITPLEAPGSLSINPGNEYFSVSWVEGSSILTNLTKALSKTGPVAVLGEIQFSNKGDVARAIQISSEDKDWQCKIDKLARGASLIVLVPSSSKGVVWEINYLVEHNMLEKTLVFMPTPLENNFESNEMELVEYWEDLAKELQEHAVRLPAYEGAGCFYRPQKDLSMGDREYLEEVEQYQFTKEIRKAIMKLRPETGSSQVVLKKVIANLKDC